MAEGLLGKEYIRHDEMMANKKEASCKWGKRGNKIHLPRGLWITDGLDKARQTEASVSLVLEPPGWCDKMSTPP